MYRLGMSNARLTTHFLWSPAIKINGQLREKNKKSSFEIKNIVTEKKCQLS